MLLTTNKQKKMLKEEHLILDIILALFQLNYKIKQNK